MHGIECIRIDCAGCGQIAGDSARFWEIQIDLRDKDRLGDDHNMLGG